MNGRKNSQAHAASIGQNAHENGYFTVSFPLGTPTFAAKLRASNKTPGRPAQQAERYLLFVGTRRQILIELVP